MKKVLAYCIGVVAVIPFLPQTVKDVLMWPIATRIFGKKYVQKVDMKDGFSMYGSMEDILSRIILFIGPYKKNLWEPSTSILLEKLSVSAQHIIIAGSHIGYLVLKSAQVTSGHVHAFEPIEHLYECSQKNIALNPELRKKITLTHAALGERVGELKLYSEDIRSSAIAYSGGHVSHQNIVTAPLTTIDSYVKDRNINHVDLILLDVEGFEWNVLLGAQEALAYKPDLILEVSPRVLSHTSVTPDMFIEKIIGLGYTLSFIDDYSNEYSLVPYSIENARQFFARDYVNVYATKKQ